MSEEMFIQYCSPTLAGLKTGSLFSCDCEDGTFLRKEIREYNKLLSPKGLCVIPLSCENGKALIYVFRPSRLKNDLSVKKAKKLLKEKGYPVSSQAGCLCRLACNVKEKAAFPHEIGLFLGYPPDDVIGFIENKAGGFKLCGNWKVYGNLKKAEKTFTRYKKCTKMFEKRHKNGVSIGELAVAG